MKKLLIVLIILLFTTPAFAGTAYYCDCTVSGGTGGAGTFADPFESIADINAASLSDTDDIYFLEGSTCTVSVAGDKLSLTGIDGNAGDFVTIGCYDGEDDFVCDGARPIIAGVTEDDGGTAVPSSTNEGLIHKNNIGSNSAHGYIKIQDLEIDGSGGHGIYIRGPDPGTSGVTHVVEGGSAIGQYATIDNVVIKDTDNSNLLLRWYSNTTVTDSSFTDGQNGTGLGIGALTSLGGGTDQWEMIGAADTHLVEGNTFYDCHECLDFITTARYATVQYNRFYNRSKSWADPFIFLEGGDTHIIRYNLFVDDNDTMQGIQIDNEDGRGRMYQQGGHRIYENIFVGLAVGVRIQCQYCNDTDSSSWTSVQDIDLTGNSFIDCDTNFQFAPFYSWGKDSYYPQDIGIINNISLTSANCPTCNHTNNASPTNVTWTSNLFDDTPGGNAAAGSNIIGTIGIDETPNFRNLDGSTLTGMEFAIDTNTSAALGAGTDLANCTDCSTVNEACGIKAIDYTAADISASATLQCMDSKGKPAEGVFSTPNDSGDYANPTLVGGAYAEAGAWHIGAIQVDCDTLAASQWVVDTSNPPGLPYDYPSGICTDAECIGATPQKTAYAANLVAGTYYGIVKYACAMPDSSLYWGTYDQTPVSFTVTAGPTVPHTGVVLGGKVVVGGTVDIGG